MAFGSLPSALCHSFGLTAVPPSLHPFPADEAGDLLRMTIAQRSLLHREARRSGAPLPRKEGVNLRFRTARGGWTVRMPHCEASGVGRVIRGTSPAALRKRITHPAFRLRQGCTRKHPAESMKQGCTQKHPAGRMKQGLTRKHPAGKMKQVQTRTATPPTNRN